MFRSAFVAAALVAAAGPCAHAQSGAPLPLDEAVRLATEQSRRLAASRAQAQAAREMAVAAGALPDPRLSLALSNVPADGAQRGSLTRDFMTMRSIGLMQTLTRDAKREARRARWLREADLAGADEAEARAALQRDAALAWLEGSFRQSQLELLGAQALEAERQVDVSEARYRGGSGAQADVFAARAEFERLRDRADQAAREAEVARERLARWVGDDARRPTADRPPLALPAWTTSGIETALDTALERHPRVEAAQGLQAVADADRALAEANRKSDWSVEVMYSQRGPSYSNMVSINLSVPLQWDSAQRQDRELAGRYAMVERAAAETDDRRRAARAEVRAALATWRSHGQRLERFDTQLLPLARQRSEAALTAYRSGSGPLPAVLAARGAEIETRIDRLRLELDRARLWAELNYLLPEDNDRARTTP